MKARAMGSWLRDHWGAVGLVLCAVLMFLVVWPVGEFPLNDDWAYSRVVQHFVRTGKLVFFTGAYATQLFQLLWGSLFVWLFGFSHFVLRVSTLVLAVAGALAIYALARELRAAEGLAALAGFVFLANPIATQLSFTFMTDVPFGALYAIALWLYVRGLQRDDLRSLALGGLAAGGAILTRQPGVLVPLGAALSLLFLRRPWRRRLATAAAMLAFPALAVAADLALSQAVPTHLGVGFALHMPIIGVSQLPKRVFFDLAYAGLLTAPLGIGLLGARPGPDRLPRWTLAVGVAVAFVPGLILYSQRIAMPYLGNVISVHWSFGPGHLSAGSRAVILPAWVQAGLTALALLGAAALVASLLGLAGRLRDLRRGRALPARPPRPARRAAGRLRDLRRGRASQETQGRAAALACVLVVGGLEAAAVVAVKQHLDRYLLVLVPPAAAALVAAIPREQGRRAAWFGLPAAVLLLAFGLAVTSDCLRWSAARWAAAASVEATGVPADRIEGGYEWNGWHAPLPIQFHPLPTPPERQTPGWYWPWYVWWLFPHVRPPAYVISDSPLPGHDVIRTIPFSSAAGRAQRVYILRPRPGIIPPPDE
jgi:4-amino-4-deoxy-L-arabinose transferase-like glycosyltransferase